MSLDFGLPSLLLLQETLRHEVVYVWCTVTTLERCFCDVWGREGTDMMMQSGKDAVL